MKLARGFFERNTLVVARELLGKYLVHKTSEGETTGKIVEVEAYIGPDDAAAHTYKGLRSNRTEIIFGPGGYAYVYLIYGMYYCFNIVTNIAERPEAVLVRALEPIDGLELMGVRRKIENIYKLCSGPGKLCSAMGIAKADNGADLCGNDLFLLDNTNLTDSQIVSTPRIGVDYAGEAKDYPWRYIIKGSKFVSR